MSEEVEDFANERERWAEQEAVQLERNRDYLRTECLPGWLDRLKANPHPDTARHIYEICLKMQHYTDMTWALRKPRYARLEQEAYEAHYAPTPKEPHA